ncbi:hypothetical protein [Streptococcus suis]|uniref:hypothetical protein n=1 Tax=Streptococcus suis TaxID=1307 RepID=UPI00145A984D|nr:hypothetical protein [Streptococcus suis]
MKPLLHELYTNRLMNYGNMAYQTITLDWYLEKVPNSLSAIWYNQDTWSTRYNPTNINSLSNYELLCCIISEYCLITRLKVIFQTLKQKGKTYET